MDLFSASNVHRVNFPKSEASKCEACSENTFNSEYEQTSCEECGLGNIRDRGLENVQKIRQLFRRPFPTPKVVHIMPTETGQNVTVRFSTPETPICDTTVIWKSKESDVRLSSGDDNVVNGAVATIPVNGWLETVTITAVCRKGLKRPTGIAPSFHRGALHRTASTLNIFAAQTMTIKRRCCN